MHLLTNHANEASWSFDGNSAAARRPEERALESHHGASTKAYEGTNRSFDPGYPSLSKLRNGEGTMQ